MLLCKVTGSLISTRKNEKLKGCKFLIVEPLEDSIETGIFIVADNIGAGTGEKVLVTRGSAARLVIGESIPIDAAVIGIVDDYTGK